MRRQILPAVPACLLMAAISAGPVLAQEAADTGGPEPQVETQAPPPEEAPSQPEAPPVATDQTAARRTDLLEALQVGFPADLPFFGAQLMGLSETRPDEWKNLPIAPFYEIGVSDEIVITAWGSFDLNLRLTVNDQGYVTLPGEDRVYVNGFTFDQLEGLLLEKLRNKYSEALAPHKLASGLVSFEVTLGKVRGIQVMITGQVAQPGGYIFERPLVLLMDALSRAGGITTRGSLRSIQIRRAKKTIHIDMYDLLTQGDIDIRKYLLRARDVLTVPYKNRVVSIQGKVRNPAIYESRPGEKLADLIEMAGQLDADRERLQIRRISSAQAGLVLIDIDLADKKRPPVKLQDRDQITVRGVSDEIRVMLSASKGTE